MKRNSTLAELMSANHQTVSAGASLLSLAFLLLAFFGIVSPAAGAGSFAMAGVAGTLSEASTPEEHLVRDVSDALTFMDESAQVPLDQMLRRMRRRKPAESIIIEWERVDRTPPRQDTVDGAVAEGTAGSSVDIGVDNVAMWKKNDLVLLTEQSDPPLLIVTEVSSGSDTITVYALPTQSTKTRTSQSYDTVPAIADGETIIRIANSKTESDEPSPSRIVTPEQLFNYVHTFDAVVEASDHRQRTKNYTQDDWKRGRATNLIDLRRSMEYNYFWGKPSVTVGENGELRWTMGGLLHYVDQTISYTADNLDESTIVDWHTEIYSGNTGSKNRVLFADKNLAADIDKVMLAKMQHVPTRNVAGVMATELKTRHGRTMVVHHPGFDELSKEYFGVVVDLKNVAKAELQSLNKQKLNYKEAGVKDSDAEQYIEKSTLEVRNPDVHFKIEGS